jgi:hypothetical protein
MMSNAERCVASRKGRTACVLGLCVVTLAGCESATQRAITRVFVADRQYSKDTVGTLPNDGYPSQIASAIGAYCLSAEQMDTSDTPPRFQVAYKQHLRAWREMQVAIAQLPDGLLAGVFAGAFNRLLRGELDGGAGRFEGSVLAAQERIRSTWEEVERIAAEHGVVAPK